MRHIFLILAMKNYLFPATCLLLAACSEQPAQRPEPEPEAKPLPTAWFSPTNPTSVMAENAAQSTIHLTVVRATGQDADARSFDISARGENMPVTASAAVFAASQQSTNIEVRFDASTLAPGQSCKSSLTICNTAPCDTLPQTWCITVSRPEAAPTTVSGTYIHDFQKYDVTITELSGNGNKLLHIIGDGFERLIEADGANARLRGGIAGKVGGKTICEAADARQIVSAAGFFADYIYYTDSSVSDNGKRYNLVACYDAETQPVCCIDYLLINDDNTQADSYIQATMTDGWFLPAVSINAQIFNPAEHQWPVWLQQCGNKQIFRITDPYRATACVLTQANMAPAGSELLIDARDPDFVTVEVQPACFYNPDIHASHPYIADFGALYGKTEARTRGYAGTYVEADGCATIMLPCPVSGLDPTALAPLNNLHPSTIRFQLSSISDI